MNVILKRLFFFCECFAQLLYCYCYVTHNSRNPFNWVNIEFILNKLYLLLHSRVLELRFVVLYNISTHFSTLRTRYYFVIYSYDYYRVFIYLLQFNQIDIMHKEVHLLQNFIFITYSGFFFHFTGK